LPRTQAELFDGVHLPDGVGFPSGVPDGGRLAAGRRRRLCVATEPTLQGAGAGQVGEFGVQATQTQTQVGRSPGRMLLMQPQGLLQGRGGRRRGGTGVGGTQRRFAPALEGLAQTADGARSQPQALGNDGGGPALSPQGEDLLPDGERKGSRHKDSETTTAAMSKRAGRKTTNSLDGGQTRCRY
jgi:hypothetical protein